jgi:hypothetical protein
MTAAKAVWKPIMVLRAISLVVRTVLRTRVIIMEHVRQGVRMDGTVIYVTCRVTALA